MDDSAPINDEKLHELGQKLALFSGASGWQMSNVNQPQGVEYPPRQLEQLPTFSMHYQHNGSNDFRMMPSTPAIGMIDSESNPIAASLLMSFNSRIPEPEPQHNLPSVPVAPAVPVPIRSMLKSSNSSSRKAHGKPNSNHHHNYNHSQQRAVLPQARSSINGSSGNNGSNKRPPPPPPPQVSDTWVTSHPRGMSSGSRLRFSDVVKKSLNDDVPKQQQTASRPMTPALPTNNQQLTVLPPATSSFSMSRHGKPIQAVAPVQAQQLKICNDAKIARRPRSSTSGAPCPTGDVSNTASVASLGSSESVFADVSVSNQEKVTTKRSNRNNARNRSLWSAGSSVSGDIRLDDSEHDQSEVESRQGQSDVEPVVRQRSIATQRSRTTTSTSSRKTVKKISKLSGSASSKGTLFMMAVWAYLSRLGSAFVVLLLMIGSCFRYILRKIFQGAVALFSALVRAFRAIASGVSKLTPPKPEPPERNMSYMALLRLYGLPRPVPLPASADLTLKRLVQLHDDDAYTILGCHVDAKQDDINVRLRQLARLLTQNHKKSQQLEEANATFRRVCNDVGSREARQRYDCELVAWAEMLLRRQAARIRKSRRRPSSLFDTSLASVLGFQCADCGIVHQLAEVPARTREQARACNRCGPSALHAAEIGDLWAESTVTYSSGATLVDIEPAATTTTRYFACLILSDSAGPGVFDVTDAIACCRMRPPASRFKFESNNHVTVFKLDITARYDEDGHAEHRPPNPTAIRGVDVGSSESIADTWPKWQVHQVHLVTKDAPAVATSTNNTSASSTVTRRGRRKGGH